MSTLRFLGSAAAVAKVITCTVGGTIEATDLFKITIGGKTLTVIAGATDATTVGGTIVTAFNALSTATYPEFSRITAADNADGTFTLTADDAGVDFFVTLATTETGGGASDSQTFTQAVTVANAGPNDWSTAANWSTAAVPVNADHVILDVPGTAIKYGLDQSAVTLASLTRRTGTVGLSDNNTAGYAEYRGKDLKIGVTLLQDYGGGGMFNLNVGTVATTINIHNFSVSTNTGYPSFLFVSGTPASGSNVINGFICDLGIAYRAGEVATVNALNVTNSNALNSAVVQCGKGATVPIINNDGGLIYCDTSTADIVLNQKSGDTTIYGTANDVTLKVYGGNVRYNTTANIAAGSLVGSYGVLDFRSGPGAVAIDAGGLTRLTGGKIYDPQNRITRPWKILNTNGGMADGLGDLGTCMEITIDNI